MLLAGDIGGTKTKLAIYSPEDGARAPIAEQTFSSQAYDHLESIAQAFLEEVGVDVERACFGVAGPIIENRVDVTNLPWVIDARTMEQELDLESVILLNDLAAIANGVPFLRPDELHTLHKGTCDPLGAVGVMAPGTGLGEAFLTWDGERYQPQDSEGGHTDFAPTTARQVRLLSYLLKDMAHVSYETVCSGRGIPNIYRFLKEAESVSEPDWMADRLADADDPTPIIAKAALDSECELCTLTMDTFVSIMGAEAGNIALKVMATGGVYLGGGIPPKILPLIKENTFLTAFFEKGRLAHVVERIPVHVILNPDIALFGAACHGLELGGRLSIESETIDVTCPEPES